LLISNLSRFGHAFIAFELLPWTWF